MAKMYRAICISQGISTTVTMRPADSEVCKNVMIKDKEKPKTKANS